MCRVILTSIQRHIQPLYNIFTTFSWRYKTFMQLSHNISATCREHSYNVCMTLLKHLYNFSKTFMQLTHNIPTTFPWRNKNFYATIPWPFWRKMIMYPNCNISSSHVKVATNLHVFINWTWCVQCFFCIVHVIYNNTSETLFFSNVLCGNLVFLLAN